MGGLISCLEGDYRASSETWQVAPTKWGTEHEITGQTTHDHARQYNQRPQEQVEEYQPHGLRQPLPPVTQPNPAERMFGQPLATTIAEEGEREERVAGEARLPQAPKNWSCGELIGAGAFGRVYLGLNNDNGELVAVKQVTISKEEAVAGRVAQHVRELEKEVNVLKTLDHPNIVRYLGTDRSKDCLNIFLEYVPGGSISSLLAKFGSFKETVIKIYARQILLGLQYLHANKIVHRDIKGANILVDKAGYIKLADFGASKKIEDLVTIDSGVKSIKGTSYWMAPEVIKQTGHGRMADIWSFGCTLIEMYTGKPPWSQFSSQVSAMFHIASSKGPPPIPEHLSAQAKDFLLLCFDRVPANRPNATRLLQHPFLADAMKPSMAFGAPDTNLAPSTSPQRMTPLKEVSEKVAPPANGLAPPAEQNLRQSSSSSEFYKLYSPMADRMAEAARLSSNGDRGRGGREVSDAQWPRTDAAQLRQSVASAASVRYDGAEDDVASQASSRHKSDSDYNPVEEPSWVQQDSLVGTHFSYDHDASPAATPRIRAYAVEQSTAVGSPMREQRRGRSKQQPFASPQAVARVEESMEDINSFIKMKADRETMRLSMPFGPRVLATRPGAEDQGSRQQQWEDELMQELASHRNNRS